MSNEIHTTVPIPVDKLREIIGDNDVKVIVDLSNSSVKPLQALIYLSNLELNVDVVFNDEDKLTMLDAYLRLPTLLKCEALETLALSLILHLKGTVTADFVDLEWAEERRELITKWASLIDSTLIYMTNIVEDDDMKTAMDEYPADETNDMIGVNFVHLFTHPLFPLVFESIDQSLIRNYTKYFNDYMYKGHNLYHYWAVPENDVHVMFMALVDDEVATDEEFAEFIQTLNRIETTEAE